jgi:glucokinase
MTVCIGIDLGGTKIAAAAVDVASGEVAGRAVVPTEAHAGPAHVLTRVAEVVQRVVAEQHVAQHEVVAIGMGVPGVLDPATGVTKLLPNLATGWRNVPAGAELQRLTGMPSFLVNDARAFTLAEASLGAGRGAATVVGVTLGTGIGGGVTIHGHLHLGIDMSAGEIGHMTIDPAGPPCGCGNRGCFEAFASGPAIASYGVYAVLRGYTTIIGDLVERDLNRISPRVIMQAAEQGDAVAAEILERSGTYIGLGLANLVTLLSPEKIVVGGGTANLGEWLLGPARREIERRCHVTPLERVEVVRAVLGDDAGIIGAAVWAGQQHAERAAA